MLIPHETIEKDLNNSDLHKFIDLYKSFGIKCLVDMSSDKLTIVLLTRDSYLNELSDTQNKKIVGYNGFHSEIIFDSNGKFIEQGIWE